MNKAYPLTGEIELTYQCNFKCPHCYCQGSENNREELTTKQLTSIIDQLHKEGCLNLTLTGGEPLLRPDFSDIYIYSKKKGFIMSVLTNGSLLNRHMLKVFTEHRPYSIEITLNGISEGVFDKTTGTRGNLKKVLLNIYALVKKGIPVVLKSIGMKINKNEVLKIKKFSDSLLGKGRFKLDPLVVCRLNGDKAPAKLRLSPDEIHKIENRDSDIAAEKERILSTAARLPRAKKYLYQCINRLDRFSIDPFGRLRYCSLIDTISADLKKNSFRESFYNILGRYRSATFPKYSICKDCKMRVYCCHCPARAYLETGSCESPVGYFCKLAIYQKNLKEKKGL